MTTAAAVFLAIALQQLVFAGMWLALAWQRLARRASLVWSVTSLLIAMGISLIALRGQIHPWVSFVAANTLMLLAFLTLRHGVMRFVRRATNNRHLPWLVLAFAAVLTALERTGHYTLLAASCALLWGAILLHLAWLIARDLRIEFGPWLARVCALPLVGVALSFAPRAFVLSTDATVQTSPGGGLAGALVMCATMLALNLSLVGLMVARIVLRLRHHSDHDPLTGLLNRRSMQTRMTSETTRVARYGGQFALLSIDIDHFKHVNDTRGHPAGDRVLCEVAATLRQLVRQVDSVARVGGEEFWVLLPATDAQGAMHMAQRMRMAVREGPQGVTVSIGVATAPVAASQETVEALLHRLDDALYRAKREGRDRVILAPAPQEEATV